MKHSDPEGRVADVKEFWLGRLQLVEQKWIDAEEVERRVRVIEVPDLELRQQKN